ncbi:hypothetical protein DAPPUDRAFT_309731 [Daphnia pulex]|uniref:Platelet-derived growth factor (PDGF) family profile domain-containing protein n=1 Tax=Daphnia pulex TaxID=6669 RepID=E9FQM6_DAPPU|nr:hypothetical protein DAPPUDRAFT_309731 [Daphnia pulex]|eukprot:EFX90010.1 hypothetical protein DAPPUDRAFT_309731 [Daphnia pulex]
MKFLSICIALLPTVCILVPYCFAVPLLEAVQHNESNSIQGAQPSQRNVDAVQLFPTVSISTEVEDLGNHSETLCPFRVENRTLEMDHHLGNFVIEYTEIVCRGSCKHCNAGRSCKQIMTLLEINLNNTVTGLMENVVSTGVAMGCTCTPDDSGASGEDVP